MSDRVLRELLDAATRDIPAGVSRPPLERIRRRGRMRRFAWPISISGGLGAFAAATAVALLSPTAQPQPEPEPLPSPIQATWSHAYVTEAGQTLTIYIHRPRGRCVMLANQQATVSESDNAVLVSVTGEVAKTDCGNQGGEGAMTVRLERPLGGRELRDGGSGQVKARFADEHLPVIPTGGRWWPVGREATSGQLNPDAAPRWVRSVYTTPGGPDIRLDGYHMAAQRPLAPAIDTIRLGTREWSLHPTPTGDSFVLVWSDGLAAYHVGLEPTEGATVTEAQFRGIVAEFTWP